MNKEIKILNETTTIRKDKNLMHHLLDNIRNKWAIDDELEYEIRHAMANYAVSAVLTKRVRDEAADIASNESFQDFLNKKKEERMLIED